jgi:hypothetical protein
VMHDFNPGWDSYIERRGYGREAGLKFDDVKVEGVCRGIRSGRPDDGAPAEQRESDLNRTRSQMRRYVLAFGHHPHSARTNVNVGAESTATPRAFRTCFSVSVLPSIRKR